MPGRRLAGPLGCRASVQLSSAQHAAGVCCFSTMFTFFVRSMQHLSADAALERCRTLRRTNVSSAAELTNSGGQTVTPDGSVLDAVRDAMR